MHGFKIEQVSFILLKGQLIFFRKQKFYQGIPSRISSFAFVVGMFSGQDVTYNLSPGGGKKQLKILMSVASAKRNPRIGFDDLWSSVLCLDDSVSPFENCSNCTIFFFPWKKWKLYRLVKNVISASDKSDSP